VMRLKLYCNRYVNVNGKEYLNSNRASSFPVVTMATSPSPSTASSSDASASVPYWSAFDELSRMGSIPFTAEKRRTEFESIVSQLLLVEMLRVRECRRE